jgi:hypothetical protein
MLNIMAINLSKAESWDQRFTTNNFINFAAYDYSSVKQALIDYIKLYHPEQFQNFIESDELIAILESFAYIAELYSYRIDSVANENLLSTAQRKDSILNLAKFISYNPSRNIPGVGLVKITSISTTENIYDLNGTNLANTTVLWNDSNNPNWKSQFFAIIDSVIKSTFGDVTPNNRVQVYDQIFESYTLNNVPLTNGVIPYQIQYQNKSIVFELVSSLLDENGPYEQTPSSYTNGNNFNILYGTDGLGDSSDYTGFFILTKQGTLSKTSTITFDGVTSHQKYAPNFTNVNNIDVWLNQLQTNAAPILWSAVETVNSQNIIFNDSTDKNLYQIETLDNDAINLIFGDGDFSNIPNGNFECWARLSDPDPIPIPKSAISDITTNITYLDGLDNTQNVIFTFAAVHAIQNSAPSEDASHIKNNAPAVYSTQNRMVNGSDYNSFLLQDNTILKMNSVNRTYAGHSKYTDFSDPSDTYHNINHFGTDLSVYVQNDIKTLSNIRITSALTVLNNIEAELLPLKECELYRTSQGLTTRRTLTDTEKHNILFNYMGQKYWATDNNPSNPVYPIIITIENDTYIAKNYSAVDDKWLFYIDYKNEKFEIRYKVSNVNVNSKSTKFWSNNADTDNITILHTNTSNLRTKNNTTLLKSNIILPVVKEVLYNTPIKLKGSVDVKSLNVSLQNNDYAELLPLINNKISLTIPTVDNYFDGAEYYRLFGRVFDVPFDSYDVKFPTIELDYSFLTMDVNVISTATASSSVLQWNTEKPLAILDMFDNAFIGRISITSEKAIFKTDYPFTTESGKGNLLSILATDHTDAEAVIKSITTTKVSATQNKLVLDVSITVANNDLKTGILTLSQNALLETVLDVDRSYAMPIWSDTTGLSNSITVTNLGDSSAIDVIIRDYVYFYRPTIDDAFEIVTEDIHKIGWYHEYLTSVTSDKSLYKRYSGRSNLNYVWQHTPTSDNRINPSTSNIIDCFVITNGYYKSMMNWIKGSLNTKPVMPLPHELRASYSTLMNKKMISDEMVIKSGKLKILFGSQASSELQAKFIIVKSNSAYYNDNQIKSIIVSSVYEFFDINLWNFGDTFNFTELSTYIHNKLNTNVSSVLIRPKNDSQHFGELFQVFSMEDEILVPSITVDDIEIVPYLAASYLS